MHDDHTFSHLRSLLQRPPSSDVWCALDTLLDPLDSPPAALIDYASAHLSRWPSHLRRDASDDVFDWLEDRRPSWALSLLNAATITTAEHLRRLPLAPFAARIAHLRIEIHQRLTQRWPPRLTSLSLDGQIEPRTARLLAGKIGRLEAAHHHAHPGDRRHLAPVAEAALKAHRTL